MEWNDKPDWSYWVNRGLVDAWEGVALMHNIDPVTYTTHINTNQNAVNYTIMPDDIRTRYKFAMQFFAAREYLTLSEFVSWWQLQGFTVPSEILGAMSIESARMETCSKSFERSPLILKPTLYGVGIDLPKLWGWLKKKPWSKKKA